MAAASASMQALSVFQENTSRERETMAIALGFNQVRPWPPSAYAVPSVPNPRHDNGSQILPTDPSFIENPNQTLEDASTTTISGSLTTDQRNEQRSQDASYCHRFFEGHVVKTTVQNVLHTLGGPTMFDRLEQLRSNVHIDVEFQGQVQRCNVFESQASTARNNNIAGRYWLCALADCAGVYTPSAPFDLDYFPSPQSSLPKAHGYNKLRKYDASLRLHVAGETRIFNVFANVEYTVYAQPPDVTNILVGVSKEVHKCQQAITNADDVMTFQPTRLFVPTLSFHGSTTVTLFFYILSSERLEFCVITDCFGVNISLTAALLHLLRSASPYQLGLNPLLEYVFMPGNDEDFATGDIVPAAVHIPGEDSATQLLQTLKPLSPRRSRPFGRSTVVLGAASPSDTRIVKFAHIAAVREWRERLVLASLFEGKPTPPTYAAPIVASFAAVRLARSDPKPLPNNPRRPSSTSTTIVQRHLEVIVFNSPRGVRLAKEESAAVFLRICVQLFQAIEDAFERGVQHRDISTGNVLVANGELLLIDWEVGRMVQEAQTSGYTHGNVTGTLDTMSVANLHQTKVPLPHDDIESAVYVILKVLSTRFGADMPSDVKKDLMWDDPDTTLSALSRTRLTMWVDHQYSLGNQVIAHFRKKNAALGNLVHALLRLPLPVQRGDVPDNHAKVMASLKDLVRSAVQAVEAIQPDELANIWSHTD